jgi:hypothetical protein
LLYRKDGKDTLCSHGDKNHQQNWPGASKQGNYIKKQDKGRNAWSVEKLKLICCENKNLNKREKQEEKGDHSARVCQVTRDLESNYKLAKILMRCVRGL